MNCTRNSIQRLCFRTLGCPLTKPETWLPFWVLGWLFGTGKPSHMAAQNRMNIYRSSVVYFESLRKGTRDSVISRMKFFENFTDRQWETEVGIENGIWHWDIPQHKKKGPPNMPENDKRAPGPREIYGHCHQSRAVFFPTFLFLTLYQTRYCVELCQRLPKAVTSSSAPATVFLIPRWNHRSRSAVYHRCG